MTPPLPLDAVNNLLYTAVFLFALFIAAELIKDDKRIIIQFIILLVDGALLLIIGWLYYVGISYESDTISYFPIAGVIATFGGFCLILIIPVLFPSLLLPFRQGSERPAVKRGPDRQRPGGF